MNKTRRIIKLAIAVNVWAIESIRSLSLSQDHANHTILNNQTALNPLNPPEPPRENASSTIDITTTTRSKMLNQSQINYLAPNPNIFKNASTTNIEVKK